MLIFWIIAATMILAALAFIAPALLRDRPADDLDRDRQNVIIARERLAELERERAEGRLTADGFEQARLELEQALVLDLEPGDEPTPQKPAGRHGLLALAGIGVILPLASLLLYLSLGSPNLLAVQGPGVAAHDPATKGNELPPVEEMVKGLQQRMEENPNDAEGWFLLGRTQMMLEDYPEAVKAYERAYALVGDQPAVLVSLADALAMQGGGKMTGRAAELVKKALELDPENLTALWLSAIIAQEAEHWQEALALFERLLPLLKEEPEARTRVLEMINGNRERLGMAPLEPTAAEHAHEATAAAGEAPTANAQVRVRVTLAPELAAQAGPDDLVFVFARAMQGPRMPLAAARHKVSELPLELTLDDSMAMMPSAKLIAGAEVVVGARVSKSGDAITKPGDLTGEVSPVKVGTGQVIEVVIGQVAP